MKKEIAVLIVHGVLQIGGVIAISFQTSWIVGVGIIAVLWGHNIEKHRKI